MPTKATSLFKKFEISINSLNSYRIKFENLLNSDTITEMEIEQVYAGLYLNVFNEFEGLLEDLFYGLLKGKISSDNPNYKRLLTISPNQNAEKIVLGERNKYLDWLPLQNYTLPRVKIYFHDGIPFTLVNDTQKGNLKFYLVIRNAIAHRSEYAIRKFEEKITEFTLLPKEKKPTAFLRTIPNRTLNKTQYEVASEELKGIARLICQ